MGAPKAHSCAETRHMTYRSSTSVYGRWRSAIPSIKKKRKKEKRSPKKPKHCDMSHVRRDHPRCRSATWICMCCHTRDMVGFIKIRSGVLEPRGDEICPFPLFWLLAFKTACPVQAVIQHLTDDARYWVGHGNFDDLRLKMSHSGSRSTVCHMFCRMANYNNLEL